MATLAQGLTREHAFWQRMMIGIALFIVFGFGQFALRGYVDYRAAPLGIHLHGLVMLSWLGLAVTQATLVRRDNLALHRRLGWIGAGVAALVVAMGSYVGIAAIIGGRQPPFFSPPYFLALTQISVIGFAGMVIAAIAHRRRTDWHRRLLIGAMVIIMEPALGRLLPMPLIMPWGEWAAMLVQLVPLAILARHDRRTIGRVHRATLIAIGVVVALHVAIEFAARTPLFATLAEGLAAA